VNDDYRAEREAHPECVEMTIKSRVPSKWRFVDLETGDVWQWRDGTFKRASFIWGGSAAKDAAPKP
jgi:hypothetical protein